MALTFAGPTSAPLLLPGGVSAAYDVTAPAVIKAYPGIVVTVSCITAGSLTLNDSATTGGAALTNEIWSGALTAGQVLVLDWPCATGIVVSAVTTAVVSIAFS